MYVGLKIVEEIPASDQHNRGKMKINTYETSEKGGALIVKLGCSINDLVRIKYSVYHMKPFHFRSKSTFAGVGFVVLRR